MRETTFSGTTNQEMRPDIRAAAMFFGGGSDKKSCSRLVDMLNDTTTCFSLDSDFRFDTSYPYYDHPRVKRKREYLQDLYRKNEPFPIYRYDIWPPRLGREGNFMLGNRAEKMLKRFTNQDFGKDANAWREWIENNM